MNRTTLRALPTLAIAVVATSLLTAPRVEAQRPGRPGTAIRWAHDGEHLQIRDKWYDAKTGDEATPTPAPSDAPDARDAFSNALGKTVEVTRTDLRGTPERSTLPRQPIAAPGVRVSDDGKHVAAIVHGELWASHDGGEPKKVRDGLEGVRRFELSPTGNAVSYIDGYDLCFTRLDDGREVRVSDDGGENLFYGELDWVYQEEVYGRGNFKATWWSPTGAHLAYMRTDEEGVDTFTVVDHTEKTLGIEQLKYPKSGTTNPRATLHVVRANDGRKVAVDLSSYPAEAEILIVRVGWTPGGDQALFMIQDREQTWLDLVVADPDTGAVRKILHEQCDDGWVNRLPMPRFLADGTFLWESERTGFKHLYRYDMSGELLATLSQGEWEMRNVLRLDEDQGWIAFTGTAPGYAIGAHAYVARLDGTDCTQITKGRGTHRVSINEAGTMFIDQFSSMENPGEIWLRKIDGTDVREVAKNTAPTSGSLPVWKQIPARDGVMLDVTYTLPTGFDDGKKYPVWIETYSGPDAPSVRDSFRGTRGASDWFVLLQVNVRSASGGGMRYTKACYRQFGVQELKDIEDAVDWICENDWADASRVGISGWSYGGFMAAFALTHSDKFKCGIAGAGVYDWELYDTIYTERYMDTPQSNPVGYEKAFSCVAACEEPARLPRCSCTARWTTTSTCRTRSCFADELQKAGKQNFTFMLYPRSRHGVRSGHLGALRQQFMREHL